MLPKVIGSLPDILLGTSKLFSKLDKTLKVFDILKCSLETLMKKNRRKPPLGTHRVSLEPREGEFSSFHLFIFEILDKYLTAEFVSI